MSGTSLGKDREQYIREYADQNHLVPDTHVGELLWEIDRLRADADACRTAAREEAAAWFASYPFPSSDSDWERGRDDALVWVVRILRDPDPQRGAATGQELDVRLGEHAAKAVAERDAQIIQWLVKKGREFYAASRKAERAQGDTCAVLASKIARGAVRPDNLRMLPVAGFFEVDHIYEREHHGRRIEFRVTAIDTSPDGEQRLARGWRTDEHSDWESTDSDDLTGWVDVTEGGDAS